MRSNTFETNQCSNKIFTHFLILRNIGLIISDYNELFYYLDFEKRG